MIPALLLAAAALAGEEYRVGVFVGNNTGGAGQQHLLFATSDAQKMRDLFVERGGIAPADAWLLQDRSQGDVTTALAQARTRLAAAEAEGRDTTLVFYYSGHGDELGLELGSTRLSHDDLRHLLDESGADVRIALLDACQSGAAMRAKGGTRGPARELTMDAHATRGTAVITSSAASEVSQESEELAGGLFTHYLHSALLGAADVDGDGVVSLTETYTWVHAQTAFRARAAETDQTPSWDLDLVGAGDVPLTRLDPTSAALVFPGDLDGSYAVWDETRKRFVAEVDGHDPARLALPKGHYYVQHRNIGTVDEAAYLLRDGEEVAVEDVDFLAVAWDDTASKGDVDRIVRRAKRSRLTIQAVVGGRGFGDGTVYGLQYVPTHPVAGLSARWLPARQGVYWQVDATGGAAASYLQFTELPKQRVDVSSFGAEGVVGFATGTAYPIRAGIGLSGQAIVFTRSFPDRDLPVQTTFSLAPGIDPWVGLHIGRFVGDVGLAWHLLPVRWDDTGAPVYGELTLSLGGRL